MRVNQSSATESAPPKVKAIGPMKASGSLATLMICGSAHFLHDGFSDVIYVFLPVWAREFHLSFTHVGLLKTSLGGGTATFQIPAGILAERWGERSLLTAGTALTSIAFLSLGAAGGFASLLLILLVAGLGSSAQHPLSSSLVSKAYETQMRRVALGTYNFSGDLGKIAVPALAALAAAIIGWRVAAPLYGAAGLLAAVVILILLTRLGAGGVPRSIAGADARSPGERWGIENNRGFLALSAIGIVDSSTRTAFLTFLPFLLLAKGSAVKTLGLAFSLVFTGGAIGKFICGAIAERLGVIRTVILTEVLTGGGILLLLVMPYRSALAFLPLLGIGLNGTSSVLYGSVADFVTPERRARAYGLFYTLALGSGAIAPSLYGVVSDLWGIFAALIAVGLVVFTVIPLSRLLQTPRAGDGVKLPV